MSSPIRPLETARLRLRLPEQADARRIYDAYGTDAEVTRYLSWRPHTDRASAEAHMKQRLADMKRGSELGWMIEHNDEPGLLGMISLFPVKHQGELGYVLARAAWGQGYMSEAAAAVLAWALDERGLLRVWAVTDAENAGSARVLEKIGMEREGKLRCFGIHPNVSPEPRDCLLYAKVR